MRKNNKLANKIADMVLYDDRAEFIFLYEIGNKLTKKQENLLKEYNLTVDELNQWAKEVA